MQSNAANIVIAYCLQKISGLFGFERAHSASLTFYGNISACSKHKNFGLFCLERALSASISVHKNTSACRRQKIFGFLALKGHQLTRFILIEKFQFKFSWGGVGPILGGGVHFPSRGRVALRASRGEIPPLPPPSGILWWSMPRRGTRRVGCTSGRSPSCPKGCE